MMTAITTPSYAAETGAGILIQTERSAFDNEIDEVLSKNNDVTPWSLSTEQKEAA